MSSFNIRDFGDGAARAIRATAVNPTSPDTAEYIPHHQTEVAPVENRVSGTGNTTGTGSTAITGMGAAGSSVRNFVAAVQVANKGASACLVTIQDGSGGTALAYIYCPAGNSVAVYYPSPLKTTANTGLYFQSDASSTTLYVSAQGYTE